MEKDISIAISIGSSKSTLELVKITIESVKKNIGTSNYQMIIYVGPNIDYEIKDYIYGCKEEDPNRIVLLQDQELGWSTFINKAVKMSEGYKYFMIAHDDIELLTPNFFQEIEKTLSNIKEPIGWMSFTDEDYLNNGHWAPSTREGFYKDFMEENAWDKRKLFQFHNLKDNWFDPYGVTVLRKRIRGKKPSREYFESLDYDIPTAPVKIHTPFNHFVMVKMEILKKIGKHETWNDFSLFVDEDIGLEALRLNFNNIWIPQIKYIHNRKEGMTRTYYQNLKESKKSGDLFKEKWGFHVSPKKEELDFIKEKYKNTLIPFSIGKNSYDWEYIK